MTSLSGWLRSSRLKSLGRLLDRAGAAPGGAGEGPAFRLSREERDRAFFSSAARSSGGGALPGGEEARRRLLDSGRARPPSIAGYQVVRLLDTLEFACRYLVKDEQGGEALLYALHPWDQALTQARDISSTELGKVTGGLSLPGLM